MIARLDQGSGQAETSETENGIDAFGSLSETAGPLHSFHYSSCFWGRSSVRFFMSFTIKLNPCCSSAFETLSFLVFIPLLCPFLKSFSF